MLRAHSEQLAEIAMLNAVRLHAPRDLRLETAPALPAPGPGQVRIRVGSVGVCGSDLHMYETGRIGHTVIKSPLVLGHEFGGLVLEAADGGDRRARAAARRRHPRRGRSRRPVPPVPPVRGRAPEPLPAPLLLRRVAGRWRAPRRDARRVAQLLPGAGVDERADGGAARDARRRRPLGRSRQGSASATASA